MAAQGGTVNMETVSLSDLKRFRDLPHRSANEILKQHSLTAVRLSDTASEFVQKVAAAEEQHAQHLANIVKTFRKKTQENFRGKDPDSSFWFSTHFVAWEALLDATEQESRTRSEVCQELLQSVSQQLSDLMTKKKQLIKRWFVFREAYMSRVDKTEDHVQKLFREYQDNWSKYAEGLERGGDSIKDSVVLHTYNSHNEYVMALRAFNSLHEEFYTRQVYDMLDELQAVHEDLVKGFRTCLLKHTQINQEKLNNSLTHLSSLLEVVKKINGPADISEFITAQTIAGKVYPPPKAEFKRPDLPPPKTPEATPIDLPALPDVLQLVDLTQAPLSHSHEALKQKEFDLSTSLDKLHTEYQSVKTLLDSYRDNPALGDPNTLIEELLDMRNKVRIKEAELVMVRGKTQLFVGLSSDDSPDISFQRHSLVEDSVTSRQGQPKRTSVILVTGRPHEFIESSSRFPVLCKYCDGMIQPPISRGLRCKVCKVTVHHKCQNSIPYCSGMTPAKASPKFIPKRISMMLTKKQSSDPVSPPKAGSPDSFDDDYETADGVYEAPPVPRPPKPNDRMKKGVSPVPAPRPPPRDQSLEPNKYSALEDVFVHNSFEDTMELADSYSYCVALYDYSKQNPNDMPIEAGDVIELINTGSSDWWKGTTGGKKGYFPASYVQLVSHGDTVMKALYDFSPTASGEIALEEGQIVIMTRNDGDGWLFGKAGSEEGLFPENYVNKIQSV